MCVKKQSRSSQKPRAMKTEGLEQSANGGEALYYVIVAWLSIISWVIFSFGGSNKKSSRHDRRRKGSPAFIS
ncbi:hypothetical protein IEQ34_013079 [Dendrobium chrysotoxum]|uniref:Uncharacterized protein n=1 Tax=Dendrobium chrysotoxum TaxID=161865 RepID=A0AAV7GPZ9_DENCH|nr:hypothetical protein IEQ34_013079 [Dendrobium chrysotoxum]